MVEKIVNFSIKYKGLIAALIIIALVAGVVSYIDLPKQSFPEITYPIAVVTAVYPGATPEEMEEQVTKKIERTAMEINGYDKSDSTSMNSACVVTVRLKAAMTPDDIAESLDDLRLKMDNLKAELPDGVTSLSVNDETMETAGFVLAISSDDISNDEMLQRTDDLRDALADMDGVTKVEIWGDNPSQVQVKVNQQKLNHLGISLSEITSMISANNYTLPTGDIDIEDSQITVNTSGRYGSVDEISNTIIGAGDNGAVITLKDIADITVAPEDDSAYYLYNGEKSVVMAVYLSEEDDIVALGRDARKIIEKYRETLPEYITVNEVYYRPDVVNDDITDFVINVIEAIIIVMFVVMLGMSFRNGLIVTIAIPLSILVNFVVMPLFGLDIQFISLASLIIVLGMLVDSSVVVSDSIQVHLDKGLERRAACVQGTRKVAKSVFLSILTTCIAFAAMMTLTGTYKHVAKSLPIVVITCLVVSYIVAMVVVPMVCFLVLKPKDEKKKNKDTMLDFYDKISRACFRHKKLSIIVTVLFLVVCLTSMAQVVVHLIPNAGKSYIIVDITGDESNIAKTETATLQVKEIIDSLDETEYSLTGVGIGLPKFDFAVTMGSETDSTGALFAKMNFDGSEAFKDIDEAVDYIQAEADKVVIGANVRVSQMGFIPNVTKPVEVKIYCDDLELLNETAAETAAYLSTVEGAESVSYDFTGATKSYYIDMDTKKLNSFGLTKAEVENELNIALMGRTATVYKNNGKEYDVVVSSDISSADELENCAVKTSSGSKYMVKQFADVTLSDEFTSIKHVDGKRGAVVGCYENGEIEASAIQAVMEEYMSAQGFPEDLTYNAEGSTEVDEVMGQVGTAFLIALFIIFVILYLNFGRLRQAFLVFLGLPVGIFAGIAGLMILGKKVDFFILLGILSMLGIVLANAITLIDFINGERKSGSSAEEACLIAGRQRFRPILMSTMTTVLGLAPMVISGSSLFKGMAIMLMIGLTVAMIANLILVPIVYSLIEKEKEPKHE